MHENETSPSCELKSRRTNERGRGRSCYSVEDNLMLRITVELWPRGDHTKAETIAVMDLWNTGEGSLTQGNYEGSATTEPSPWNPNPERRGGRVTGHLRGNSVWNLIAKMLHQMGYGVSNTYRKNDEERRWVKGEQL